MAGLRVWLIGVAALAAALPCVASRVVVDETGVRVTVPDHPHRVICLVPSVTDAVYALGAGEDVVAVSDYTHYPAEAAKKPSVGTILTPSLEAIVGMRPDLVLAMRTESGAASVATLRRMGMAVYLVDPHGLEGIFRAVVSLGEALNRGAAAEAEANGLRARVARVRAGVQGRPVVRVFLPIGYDPVITIGRGAFLTEMIAVAGGRSVTDDLSQEWPQMSVEAVVARAPEALLLGRGVTLAVLRGRPGWRGIPAVVNGRVYALDGRLELASPVAVDGLEALAGELHPEVRGIRDQGAGLSGRGELGR